MAKCVDRTDSAPENPHRIWDSVRQHFAMACSDMFTASFNDYEQAFYGSAKAEALLRLMLTPAPDIEALRFKLDVFVDEDCGRLMDLSDNSIIDALKADMKRLSERPRT